jgi:hypothetical protein
LNHIERLRLRAHACASAKADTAWPDMAVAAVLGGAILCGAIPTTAYAAGRQNNDEKRQKTLGFHIIPSVELMYDDNVYRIDDRDEKPTDDIIATPSVELQYGRPVGRHDLNIRAKAGYDQFLSQSQRSKLRLDGSASAIVRFGATCSITPTATYRQQRADYGDLNAATENLQRFSTLSAELSCERAGLYPLASYQRDTTRNAERYDYANQTSDNWRAGIGYSRPSLGALTAYYEHVVSNRPALGIRNRKNAAGVTFVRSVSPLTAIDVDLQWMKVRSDSTTVGTYEGLGWDVNLSTTAISRVKLTATTERSIVNDSLIASGFAIRSRYKLGAEVALSELTSISLYAELERRKFRQDAALRPFSIEADRNRRFGAGLRRKLNDKTELLLDAQRYRRRTDSSASNYSGTQVTLTATTSF